MSLYKKSRYENIVFIVLILICFIFMCGRFFVSINCIKHFIYYIAYPNLSAADNILKFSGNFANNIESLISLHQDNISYKQKNQELTDKLRNYELINHEYESLLKLFKLDKVDNTKSVYARIVVREPSLWYQSFIIDKGSDDGLYNELPVAVFNKTKNALYAMGTIVETYKNSSKVALITNSESILPVEIKNKGINCLVEGFDSCLVKVTYIPLNVDVKPGDELVVSNLSSIFNYGIPVGVIRGIVQEPYMDFQTATAEVFFDMVSSNIAIVLVPSEQKQ
ncbi:MAG: rod shape-determining protein MreC [Endomicrobium sp.]|uniref:rod shape-determining protein MreC n=1 Tax=Candidatus Endomicrobiellum cubanum TaxID=3242325 RepID=UPI00283718EF|nr:rod shape-determining protein MreC [Endomicrobium sp.]